MNVWMPREWRISKTMIHGRFSTGRSSGAPLEPALWGAFTDDDIF